MPRKINYHQLEPKNNVKIEKLEGATNYESWLKSIKQWADVTGNAEILKMERQQITTDLIYRVNMVKAKIASNIDHNIVNSITLQTPSQVLNEIEKRFKQPFWYSSLLFHEFINLKFKPDGDIDLFIYEFSSKYNNLMNIGITLTDSVLGYQLIMALPDCLDPIRKNILNALAHSTTTTFGEIKKLLSEKVNFYMSYRPSFDFENFEKTFNENDNQTNDANITNTNQNDTTNENDQDLEQ